MKRMFAVLLLLLITFVIPVAAQSPDDQYLSVYSLIQQGDRLNQSGQSSQALSAYLEAQALLQRLQKVFPDYSSKVVSFRLQYLEDKISGLTAKSTPDASSKLEVAVAFGAPPPTLSEADQQLQTLEGEVRLLQAEKTVLEAKLKEAYATQPAAIDPRELAKAEEKAQSLTKENELLKVALSSQRETGAPGVDQVALDETRQKLAQEVQRANTLALESEALQKKLADISSDGSAAQLKIARQQIAAANAKLEDQMERANALAIEKDSLQAKVSQSESSAAAAGALREENELLKKQLTDLKSAQPSTDELASKQSQLAQAQAGIAALQSELEILRLEKSALQEQVKNASPASDDDARLIKELQTERDELKQQLAAKPKSGFLWWRDKGSTAKIKELTGQVDAYRARVEVLEARAEPYTSQQLAMLEQQSPQLAVAEAKPTSNVSKEPPPGTAALAAEAQRLFAARQLDQAEQKYLEILKRDENNVYTLGNLAAIQLEMGHLSDAEKTVKRALAIVPDDAYCLTILGFVKFRQEQYDAALDALSRAAKLDPQNAEIQNYLGVTLSHKGMREPAEAALRKAIQINPNYASAHNNLAVFYSTQKPPLLGLARWHYNKAVAGGHPKNDELEKLLGTTPANAAPIAP